MKKTKLKQEPCVSGALIRSMVRQFTAARSKEPSFHPLPLSGDGNFSFYPGPRKQTRKRYHYSTPLHTSLPSMAQARREIVAALKLHRATVNRDSTLQQHPITYDCLLTSFPSSPVNISQSLEISLQPSHSEMAPLLASAALHPAMSDEEMAVIRSVAEHYDVEYSDRLSLEESAWCCPRKFSPPPSELILSTHERSMILAGLDLS